MRINHNIPALGASSQLKKTNNAISKNAEKLASGFRINRAADDAAGLSISEKMRAQIRALSQAERNTQDGISLVQLADGAMEEVSDMLKRMSELAVQAANGTYNDEDRAAIQKEVNNLRDAIDGIANNTEFNGIKLLDGSANSKDITLSARNILTFTFNTNPNPGDSIGVGHLVNMTKITFNVPEYLNTPYDVVLGDTLSETLTRLKRNYDLLKNGDIGFSFDQEGVLNTEMYVFGNKVYVLSDDPLGGERSTTGIDAVLESGNPLTITIPNKGNSIIIQTGAGATDNLELDMPNVTSSAIGIDSINLSTSSGATNAIDRIKSAIGKVSLNRADMGAYQNRLEHTMNNTANYVENLTASESRIRDTDMAKEMIEYTKNNILLQSTQAMLTQANSESQGVLSLLK